MSALALLAAAALAASPEGRLAPCPDAPRCVSSQEPSPRRSTAPLAFSDEPEAAWRRLKACLAAMGLEIVEERPGALRAMATSRVFRFKDDLDLLLDESARVVHVRSCSRTGRYDFGVNRRRVETLRALFGGR